ncbi:MAG: hypothetical protein R3B55_01315 [Candidatus Paceibacterota bacterium]
MSFDELNFLLLSFLTEKFRDPGSVFLPFAKLKQKYTCAFRFPHAKHAGALLISTQKIKAPKGANIFTSGDGGNRTRV